MAMAQAVEVKILFNQTAGLELLFQRFVDSAGRDIRPVNGCKYPLLVISLERFDHL